MSELTAHTVAVICFILTHNLEVWQLLKLIKLYITKCYLLVEISVSYGIIMSERFLARKDNNSRADYQT